MDKKKQLEQQLQVSMETFKKRVHELDRDLKMKGEEANEAFEAKQSLEKERKNLIAEREKMKDRIKKLK